MITTKSFIDHYFHYRRKKLEIVNQVYLSHMENLPHLRAGSILMQSFLNIGEFATGITNSIVWTQINEKMSS